MAKHIKHITEVVLESAMLYSVIILVIAILNTISVYLPLKVSTGVESYIYTTIARVLGVGFSPSIRVVDNMLTRHLCEGNNSNDLGGSNFRANLCRRL